MQHMMMARPNNNDFAAIKEGMYRPKMEMHASPARDANFASAHLTDEATIVAERRNGHVTAWGSGETRIMQHHQHKITSSKQ